MAEIVCQGWLEKKSGGKSGGKQKATWMDKWDKRYFVLVGTELLYYKHENDHAKGAQPQGSMQCAGAELFLKEVTGTTFRFTIQNQERELKLRAPNAGAYHDGATHGDARAHHCCCLLRRRQQQGMLLIHSHGRFCHLRNQWRVDDAGRVRRRRATL